MKAKLACLLIASMLAAAPHAAASQDEITVTADSGRMLQMTTPPSAIEITYPLAGKARSITIAIMQDGQHSPLADDASLYRFDRFRQRDIKQFVITVMNGRRKRTVRVPRAWLEQITYPDLHALSVITGADEPNADPVQDKSISLLLPFGSPQARLACWNTLQDALGPAYDVDGADTAKQFVVELDVNSGQADYSIVTTQGCD